MAFDYDSLTVNPPMDGVHDGAKSGIVEFAGGDTLTFSCFIENESDVILRFGNDVQFGEMCSLWGTTVGGSTPRCSNKYVVVPTPRRMCDETAENATCVRGS